MAALSSIGYYLLQTTVILYAFLSVKSKSSPARAAQIVLKNGDVSSPSGVSGCQIVLIHPTLHQTDTDCTHRRTVENDLCIRQFASPPPLEAMGHVDHSLDYENCFIWHYSECASNSERPKTICWVSFAPIRLNVMGLHPNWCFFILFNGGADQIGQWRPR